MKVDRKYFEKGGTECNGIKPLGSHLFPGALFSLSGQFGAPLMTSGMEEDAQDPGRCPGKCDRAYL